MTHKSVLLQEVIESLNLHKGGTYVDGTFGAGGHSRQIARAISHEGHLISFDQDETVFNEAVVRAISEDTRFTHVVENFGNAKAALVKLDIQHIDGAMFDLGLSSTQLEESGRGFSFQRDEPLWMTFKHSPKEEDVTAIDIVNHWSEESVMNVLRALLHAESLRPAVRERYVRRVNWWRSFAQTLRVGISTVARTLQRVHSKHFVWLSTMSLESLRRGYAEYLNYCHRVDEYQLYHFTVLKIVW